MSIFVKAGPAEILRAAQKDEIIKTRIQSNLSDLFFKIFGSQVYLRYHGCIPVLARLLYAGTTTLSGLQTLGEEYTGIVQVTPGLRQIPSLTVRILMVLLDASGYLFILYLLKHVKHAIKNNEKLRLKAKKTLLEFCLVLESALPSVQRWHKALFYFSGNFYDISKRLTGIHYILIRHWLRENQSLYGFKILGFVAVAHLSLLTACNVKQWWGSRQDVEIEVAASEQVIPSAAKHKCPLCLDDLRRRRPCATTCGHVYCWNCILDWLQTNHQCPVCRVSILPSRIIPLSNW